MLLHNVENAQRRRRRMSALGQSLPNRHRAGTPGAGGQADENWLKSDIAAGMLHVEGTAEVTRTWPIGRE